MTLPSNGITADVIREIMPPYHLSPDLLEGAVTALPPPPPGAPARWRLARLTRLVHEVSVLMPADAVQARLAAQIVVIGEMTDDTFSQSNAAGLTVEQVCRVRRTAADLTRTAATLERALSRRQQKPAPFFGSVLADEVDIAALDVVWCKATPASAGAGARACAEAGPTQQPATLEPAAGVDPVGPRPDEPGGEDAARASAGVVVSARGVDPDPTGDQPDAAPPAADVAPPAADAAPSAAVAPMPRSADTQRMRRDRPADAAARPGRDAGSAPEWAVTRLDQGPGWTLEVVRPRPGAGAAEGSGAR